MKKQYIIPTLSVVDIHLGSLLLEASKPKVTVNSGESSDPDGFESRRSNTDIWDD